MGKREDILNRLSDALKLWKELSGKFNKTKNIMIINIIGKKEKKHKALKASCSPFGDLAMKRRRNM